MTIKQQGGIFGRNPTFNDVETNDLTTSGSVNLDGPVTVNGSGADADFRVEGDTDANLIWVDASRDKVGIGHNWAFDKNSKLRVEGPYLSSLSTSSVSAFSASGGGAVATWIGGVGYSYGYIQAIQDDASMNLKQLWLNPLGGDVRVADGNLIIGTSGKGIDFSATSGTGTSELFDDYEEGTWTPTLKALTTDFDSVTYDAIRSASYTKIGRVVQIQLTMRTDAITVGSATGLLAIGGLPFTPVTGNVGASSLSVSVGSAFASNTPMAAEVSGGADDVYLLYRSSVSGNTAYCQAADAATGANANYVRISGTYTTS